MAVKCPYKLTNVIRSMSVMSEVMKYCHGDNYITFLEPINKNKNFIK